MQIAGATPPSCTLVAGRDSSHAGCMMAAGPRTPTLDDYADGVRAGDRAMLGRAITLVESAKDAHMAQAQALLQRLLPFAGKAYRLGITGARWGLAGAEAILRLRAIHSSGDWDAYWRFHERQEATRNYAAAA